MNHVGVKTGEKTTMAFTWSLYQLLVGCQYGEESGHTILTYFAIMSFFSDYYNTAARIIVLMEETCNMFIDMARKFLDPGSIFQIEVEVAIA